MLTLTTAPRWRRGYIVEVVFVSMVWIVFTLGYFLHRRDLKRAGAFNPSDEEETEVEVVHIEILEGKSTGD
jgi:hypothetical protein